jgi:hypothetical protein
MKTKKLFYFLPLLLLVPAIAWADPIPLAIPGIGYGDMDMFTSSLKLSAILFIIGTICELIVGYLYCLATKTPKRILKWIIYANLISYPIVALAAQPFFEFFFIFSILILEILVVVFEGFFIYHFNKNIISVSRAFILSLIMNLVSFLFPIILFAIIYEMHNTPQF